MFTNLSHSQLAVKSLSQGSRKAKKIGGITAHKDLISLDL
jgi:hypothetical protein